MAMGLMRHMVELCDCITAACEMRWLKAGQVVHDLDLHFGRINDGGRVGIG